MQRTLEVVFHKGHRVVVFAGAHLSHAGREAGDWQNDNIADLLSGLHAGELLPGDVALAVGHVEVLRVVEVAEDEVGPERRASELDDVLVVVGQLACALADERLLGDVGDNVTQHGVAGLGLDGPLAELDAA